MRKEYTENYCEKVKIVIGMCERFNKETQKSKREIRIMKFKGGLVMVVTRRQRKAFCSDEGDT